MNRQLRTLRGRPAALAMFCLGVAATWLVLVSIVAMIAISPEHDSLVTAARRPDTVVGNSTLAAAGPTTTTSTTTVAASGTRTTPTTIASSAEIETKGVSVLPPTSGPGDTTGVTDTEIHIGIHAPET